jgi:hypothetical protein
MSSSLHRIQRFMAEYLLDTDIIARFVFALLPNKPHYRLALDRPNWKIGATDINILILATPILYKMMPKFGNSSTAERINLMQRSLNYLALTSMTAFWGIGSLSGTIGWNTLITDGFDII